MKGLNMFMLLSLLFTSSFLIESGASQGEKEGVYIVYMGFATLANGSSSNYHHTLLLNSLLKQKKNAVVHSYTHGISGFAARLSAAEAQAVSKKPGVVSVFPDPVFKLHTTRSWDFLKYETDVEIYSTPNSDTSSSGGSDTIIGILDTGIWPESDSFKDKDLSPIASSRWKGICMHGDDFNSSNCNRKIIGARYYADPDGEEDGQFNSPRDTVGHGTHVAATAAGSAVPGASYYGLASGTAKGGSPGSRIAVYRVCSENGCFGSNILAGFADAIADGVDILSLSLGAAFVIPDFKKDPIAIGAFHAVENGITVVCSAGNQGPYSETVANGAPWILTVAATTIDRDFESDVVLGGNKVIKGEGINFADIQKSPVYPLIYAKTAKNKYADEENARSCAPDSLDNDLIKGKIVFCENSDSVSDVDQKEEVKNKGGIGLISIDDQKRAVATNYKEFPMTLIGSKDASEILSYINSTEHPVATVLPTKEPDIAAPGVNILAAWLGNDPEATPEGKKPAQFNLLSGTSMACPHVSGLAAVVKSYHPSWSPSAVKSAIMTTASQTDNTRASITTETGARATAYDYGAGEINTTSALEPGLVYETTTIDYLNFLCYHGYNASDIAIISKNAPPGFTCPKESSP
ncbi:hypothetical protein Tsubulata_048696, partial [Turnera subulata]